MQSTQRTTAHSARQEAHNRNARRAEHRQGVAEAFALVTGFGGLIFGLGLAGSPYIQAMPTTGAALHFLDCYLFTVFALVGLSVAACCHFGKVARTESKKGAEAFALHLKEIYPPAVARQVANIAAEVYGNEVAADAFAEAFGK